MFKSPIEWIKELIQEFVGAFANMAFDLIAKFMLAPTDFSKYNQIDELHNIMFGIATSLGFAFICWSLFSIMLQNAAGVESRSIAEIVTKGAAGFVAAASAPWILEKVLLKLNNAIVQYFLDLGLDTEALEKYGVVGTDASIAVVMTSLVATILFVLLGLQYIQRLGEYIVLLVTSPIAAQSLITDNFEIFSVWWRESISVIFTQAFQVSMLWLILNLFTGNEELELIDYWMAIGLMIVILKGPKYFRQFLYSSGAGRGVAGAVGGTSKMMMYKYASAKLIKK